MSQTSLSDEALWFPAHMSAGDSFSRPTGVDGAPPEEDGIGLPGRRPSGKNGGNGPRNLNFRAAGWLWITLCGVTALGIVTVAARKEIAETVAESWLKGQGVKADVKIDTLSLKHASGSVLIGDVKKPEMSIGHFDVSYALTPFAGNGLPLARIKTLHVEKPVVAISIRNGKLKFGSLDRIVQDALSAKPSNAPPPEEIVVEGADIRLDSDYGLLTGHGGLSLRDGLLTVLDLKLPATHLTGTLGTGDLREGRVTAHSVNMGTKGDQLQVQAHLVGDNWTVKGAGNLVETIGAEDQRFHAQNVVLDLDSHLPYRHSKSTYDAFSGPMDAAITLTGDELVSEGTRAEAFETQVHFDGALKTNDKGVAYSGKAQLTASADRLQSGEMQGKSLSVSGHDLTLNTGFSSETGLAFNLNGPVTGEAGHLQQGDVTVQGVHLTLSELAMASDADGAKATFTGAMTVGHLAQGADLSLNQTTLSLNGGVQAGADAGPWDVTIKSDIRSERGHYGGLSAMAKDRVAARAEAAAKPPIPGAPMPQPPDAIITLDQAFQRFALRVRGLSLNLHGDADTPAGMEVRVQSAEAALNGGGKATLVPHASKPLVATGQPGAVAIALTGGDLPQVALSLDGLTINKAGSLSGAYDLAAQFDFDPLQGAQVKGHGRFNTLAAGGFNVTLAEAATFTAQSAQVGDNLTGLSGEIVQTGPSFLVYTPQGWRVTGAYRNLGLAAPNEIVRLAGGQGSFQAYSLGDALGYKATLDSATLTDGVPAAETRFKPLLIDGAIEQDRKATTGRFFAATPSTKGKDGKPLRIAAIDLDSDVASGAGSLSFKTLDLNFTPEGLQPVYLSPMVAAVFSRNVSGPMRFEGAFDWTKTTSSSHGTLDIGVGDFVAATATSPYGIGMSFFGATGQSQGLTGQIVFDSLSPLHTPPGQKIRLAETKLGVPLTDMDLSLQILGDHMALEQASVESPGGPVRLEPTEIWFDAKKPITGVLAFDGLDFGKVIAASDLNTSMSFKGNLSGHLPFTYTEGHLAFANGTMKSDAPGQISIYRTAVTGVNTATGSVTSDAPPATAAIASKNAEAAAAADPNFNPFQDLAFQAMEHIAYEQIDARLNSTDGGILNTSFHIKGYYDPPQPQKAKISLFDYISGKWMQKPIKLPSKTPVELYLEIPVNLDEVLSDLAAFYSNTAQKPEQ
ncbi:MAG: YdbH domain-containing protein [Asticcacaulis sp.]|uniref:intermembrane phospholipid transport protein YdbH family protein n=1 Tax=Asticcacaulis sp. TaxID=1872648 RepID=UPI0039E6AA12